jgi:hypothetical protein
MRNAVKQYNFIKKELNLKRYSIWFKEVDSGFLNGSDDIKSMGLMVSKIRVVLQRESGGKLLSVRLKRFSPLERSWNLTRVDVLPSLVLEQRLSIGNLNRERFVMCHLFLLLPIFSLVMERQGELKPKEMVTISLILMLPLKRWETSIKQTLWDPDISGVQKALLDSIPSTLWMWLVILPTQVNLPINKLFLSVGIWLKHGDLWALPGYRRWIMRSLLQVEDAILIAYLNSCGFICFWASIWYSFHRENREEMHLWRVSINSGKRELLEDIIVLTSFLLNEPVRDLCSITIMKNHTGVLHKKNMAQDSLVFLKSTSGNPSDTSQKVLILKNTGILMVILVSLLQKGDSLLSERLTPMGGLRSMGLPISLERNLRDNMLLLLSLLMERDWLLNKIIRLPKPSLSQLTVMLVLLCFQLQRRKAKEFPMLLYS